MSDRADYYPLFSRVEGVRGWEAPHWRVELFDGAGRGHLSRPMAVAYVTDYAPVMGPMLDYLTVFDQHRGRGCVLPLMRAIHERWPGIRHTERLTPDGEFRA